MQEVWTSATAGYMRRQIIHSRVGAIVTRCKEQQTASNRLRLLRTLVTAAALSALLATGCGGDGDDDSLPPVHDSSSSTDNSSNGQ